MEIAASVQRGLLNACPDYLYLQDGWRYKAICHKYGMSVGMDNIEARPESSG